MPPRRRSTWPRPQLREANLDVEFTEVRAPIAGRISDSRVDEGNLVTGDPGATLLTTLVALDPIHFVFDMSESDYLDFQRAVDAGQLPSARDHSTNVQVRLADEPDTETWPHIGHMDFVDNRIDQSAGTIRARAEIPNPDHFITPGQFGQLRLPGSPEYEAILVPESAIVADQSNKMVMTVTGDGTVEPRVIRDGPRYAGSLRIIRRGLEPGDRIIINGLMRARPGAKVDPQPGTIDPPSPEAAVTQADARAESCRAHGFRAFLRRPSDLRDGRLDLHHRWSARPPTSPCRSRSIPEIAPPTIQVSASYPGASAETVSDTVATPLEQEINGVDNMLYMVSQATGDGQLSLTVTFALGTDLDIAQVLVQNRVAIAEPRLPEEVRRLGVTVRKNSPDMLMVIHLSSPDESRDQLYISNYATLQVRDVLARIDGVGDVRVFGARDYAMRIWLDPEKTAARNLTAGEVVAAIRAQNVQVASGVLNQPPIPTDAAFQLNVETEGPASTTPTTSSGSSSRPTRTAASPGSRDIGAGRARRAGLQRQRLSRRAPGRAAADLPAAGLERARDRRR